MPLNYMTSLKNSFAKISRINKSNIWFILLGVGLLFIIFYYFLGKKFGIREGQGVFSGDAGGDASAGDASASVGGNAGGDSGAVGGDAGGGGGGDAGGGSGGDTGGGGGDAGGGGGSGGDAAVEAGGSNGANAAAPATSSAGGRGGGGGASGRGTGGAAGRGTGGAAGRGGGGAAGRGGGGAAGRGGGGAGGRGGGGGGRGAGSGAGGAAGRSAKVGGSGRGPSVVPKRAPKNPMGPSMELGTIDEFGEEPSEFAESEDIGLDGLNINELTPLLKATLILQNERLSSQNQQQQTNLDDLNSSLIRIDNRTKIIKNQTDKILERNLTRPSVISKRATTPKKARTPKRQPR